MSPWVAVATAAVVIAIAAPSIPAQSLAEVAARTKKKDEKKPAKVYTEADLRGRPAESGSVSQMDGPDGTSTTASTLSPAPGMGGAVPPAGEKPKSEDEERAEKQAEWRARLQHAESEVVRISGEVDRAQTALNDLTGALYGGNRATLTTRVEEGKRQLALAQQLVQDTQEEGRRARFR